MGVRANRFILSVDKDPQTYLVLGVIEMLSYASFESLVGFTLENSESGQVRCWPRPLVKLCQIKALVMPEGIIGNNFGSEVEMLFFPLLALGFDLQTLFIQSSLFETTDISKVVI